MAQFIPNYGVPYNEGVKLIKISKIDGNGIDQTNVLSQLQSISFSLPNGTPITYIIVGTQEYLNYFLYHTAVNATDIAGGLQQFALFSPAVANFVSSDYDVTYGLADFPQFSRNFMDVSYGWEGGINTPLNFGLIISGTADRAAVQDSNYSSRAWSNIRYNGSRISSRNFNVPF
jgi:hypothetical protein